MKQISQCRKQGLDVIIPSICQAHDDGKCVLPTLHVDHVERRFFGSSGK
ncbi:hypothetical protein [Persicitalea jodogahamensis]|nr:hypothetical protein [Persicitalea jodogahamensis]